MLFSVYESRQGELEAFPKERKESWLTGVLLACAGYLSGCGGIVGKLVLELLEKAIRLSWGCIRGWLLHVRAVSFATGRVSAQTWLLPVFLLALAMAPSAGNAMVQSGFWFLVWAPALILAVYLDQPDRLDKYLTDKKCHVVNSVEARSRRDALDKHLGHQSFRDREGSRADSSGTAPAPRCPHCGMLFSGIEFQADEASLFCSFCLKSTDKRYL